MYVYVIGFGVSSGIYISLLKFGAEFLLVWLIVAKGGPGLERLPQADIHGRVGVVGRTLLVLNVSTVSSCTSSTLGCRNSRLDIGQFRIVLLGG